MSGTMQWGISLEEFWPRIWDYPANNLRSRQSIPDHCPSGQCQILFGGAQQQGEEQWP